MRARDASRLAHASDDLSGAHSLADLHAERAQMAVERDETLAVIHENGVAVEEEVADVDHPSISRRDDGRTERSGDIHPRVRIA